MSARLNNEFKAQMAAERVDVLLALAEKKAQVLREILSAIGRKDAE